MSKSVPKPSDKPAEDRTAGSQSSEFIIGGRHRILTSQEYILRKGEIRAMVAAKYKEERSRASMFKRIVLWIKMAREIHRELEKLAPKDALYLRAGDENARPES